MSEQLPNERRSSRPRGTDIASAGAFGSLQFILWGLWTAAVVGRSYLFVRAALLVEEKVDLIGLVIHSMLVGVTGMVVITVIEMRLEPWRFLDDGDD